MKYFKLVSIFLLGFARPGFATTYGSDDCALMKRYGHQMGKVVNDYESCVSVCKRVGSVYGTCQMLCTNCGYAESTNPASSSGEKVEKQISIDEIVRTPNRVLGKTTALWLVPDGSSGRFFAFEDPSERFCNLPKCTNIFLTINEELDEFIKENKKLKGKLKLYVEFTIDSVVSDPIVGKIIRGTYMRTLKRMN